jgi:hypothetical protein
MNGCQIGTKCALLVSVMGARCGGRRRTFGRCCIAARAPPAMIAPKLRHANAAAWPAKSTQPWRAARARVGRQVPTSSRRCRNCAGEGRAAWLVDNRRDEKKTSTTVVMKTVLGSIKCNANK